MRRYRIAWLIERLSERLEKNPEYIQVVIQRLQQVERFEQVYERKIEHIDAELKSLAINDPVVYGSVLEAIEVPELI